jgi:hypothetical protein
MNYYSINCTLQDKIFSQLPLTTTIVEQTFSYLKNILNEHRRNLKVSSLKMLIDLSFNKFN